MSSPNLKPLPLPPGIHSSQIPVPDVNLSFHALHTFPIGTHSKPLLLLLHGFPEIAYSWRKIMHPLAAAEYNVIAIDQRGYGRTETISHDDPWSLEASDMGLTRLILDTVSLVKALGYESVHCLIGHDFGAYVAPYCALARPDIFRSCIVMSHPFKGAPTAPFDIFSPSFDAEAAYKTSGSVNSELAALNPPRKHYKWYYAGAKIADTGGYIPVDEMTYPLETLPEFLRGYFHLKSGDWAGNQPEQLKAWSAPELAKMPYYYVMPLHASMREAVALHMADEDGEEVELKAARWLPKQELQVYAEEWGRTTFKGGLDWYLCSASPPKMRDLKLFSGMKLKVPSLFIAGDKDWGVYQEPGAVEGMARKCEDFRGVSLIPGAGHWVQQEKPDQVVKEIFDFLNTL